MLVCFRWVVLALLLVAPGASPVFAWPDKPIRILVAGQAGGSGGITVRALGDELRPLLGNTEIAVDTKPGEGGEIAVDALLNATDDHTFLLMSENLLTLSLLSRSARFQPLRDFKMVSAIGNQPLVVLAGPTAPFATFAEFVTYARANPGKLTYATVGQGSVSHLLGTFLFGELKLDLTHVNSRGSGGVAADMIDGLLEVAVIGVAAAAPGIKSGKLRPLAVSSVRRVPLLPNTPTLEEIGLPGLSVMDSSGIVAPLGMPDVIVDQFAKAIKMALTDAALRKRFEEVGGTARASTPAEYTAELKAATARWRAIIEAHGMMMMD